MAKKTSPKSITIDGVDYPLDQLSDEAQRLIGNLRLTDQEITRLQHQLAMAQTARTVYANALREQLGSVPQH